MQNFKVWFLLLNGEISMKKYENTNYPTVNACGLAIFSNFTFIGSSVIYLSLSEIPILTHKRQFGLKTSRDLYLGLVL